MVEPVATLDTRPDIGQFQPLKCPELVNGSSKGQSLSKEWTDGMRTMAAVQASFIFFRGLFRIRSVWGDIQKQDTPNLTWLLAEDGRCHVCSNSADVVDVSDTIVSSRFRRLFVEQNMRPLAWWDCHWRSILCQGQLDDSLLWTSSLHELPPIQKGRSLPETCQKGVLR